MLQTMVWYRSSGRVPTDACEWDGNEALVTQAIQQLHDLLPAAPTPPTEKPAGPAKVELRPKMGERLSGVVRTFFEDGVSQPAVTANKPKRKRTPEGTVRDQMSRTGTVASQRSTVRLGDIRKVGLKPMPVRLPGGGITLLPPGTQFELLQDDSRKLKTSSVRLCVDWPVGRTSVYHASASKIKTHSLLVSRHVHDYDMSKR